MPNAEWSHDRSNCLVTSHSSFVIRHSPMNLPAAIKEWLNQKEVPLAHQHGTLGERAAKKHLKQLGLKYLTANFCSDRGEIDLVFRDDDCLVLVEVKPRSSEDWVRPAARVNQHKRRLLCQTRWIIC